jgi:beta-glucosidase-like glycosyl hydrolase
MAPFQDCVEQGKVSGLMCSYNAINGDPACANDWLLKDTARGEWGFDGYITSDCDAVGDGAMHGKYPDQAPVTNFLFVFSSCLFLFDRDSLPNCDTGPM